jgi:endonuclease/exonuclease/phosphatase family metal-dependent hydrolase
MRVAVYNQMFGLDGRSFYSNIIGHWAIHFQSNLNRIIKRIDLKRTTEIIKRSNADIIGICEVLEGQHEEFKTMLGNLGYKWVYFSRGHKLSHYDIHVIEIIASKYPCEFVGVGSWPMEDRLGGGGGIGAVYIPELETTFFNVHLAISKRKHFSEQIKYIAEKIQETDGKIILVGDFNISYSKIKDRFSGLTLFSKEVKTCSLTPIMKWFCWKDFDHILARGYQKDGFGEISGYSDHKLIYVDFV